jgi:hypothetical protein
MHANRTLARMLPIVALAYSAIAHASAALDCVVNPPSGPFEAVLEQSSQAPTASVLPFNSGASSTLIRPAPEYRWDSKGGLVESLDGSLLLHGVVSSPNRARGRLHVLALVNYQPLASAVISVWNGDRDERLGRVVGSRAWVDAKGTEATFDIELPPLTVAAGTFREIQTLVWFDGGSIDARRWTVYAGPKPPVAVGCVAANEEGSDIPTRSQLEPDGRFIVRSPRATTLAVVPLQSNGLGEVQFVSFDQARHGWVGQLGGDVELAAVWEGPFTGPGRNWISSFWSARPNSQSGASAVSPVDR